MPRFVPVPSHSERNSNDLWAPMRWVPEKVDRMRRSLAAEPRSILLESGAGFGELGRWSIFAAPSRAVFTVRGESWRLVGAADSWELGDLADDLSPLEAFRRVLRASQRAYKAQREQWIAAGRGWTPGHLPFQGGWVGFIGYDFAPRLERLPRRSPLSALPEMFFTHCNEALVLDRREGAVHIVVGAGDISGPPRNRPEGQDDRSALPSVPPAIEPPKSDWTKEEYLRAVERTIEYIGAGDIFQANITQRFSTTLHPIWSRPERIGDLWDRCVTKSPAPFSALIKTPEWSVLSTSPERFLLVEPDGRVETRPIKGTRPRGKTAKEDAAQMSELLASAKDRAELAMIVDLERNDLGRVCQFGSVKVAQHAALESYSNVHHLVSTVEGKLHDGCDVVDLLAAAFPGGSITGAPKIRAMEIIDELEACSRGIYTGAIGYISDHGRADFNIAIRTLVVEGDHAHFHVGGGITEGSDPEAEYEETLTKGSKLTQILCGEP
jgi:para-aminobenzoate synthetase component I